eukprot:TRINITY_DN276_c0_g1_i2.p1 TRINITY_DN276_c0_g1~~TRINITY_DN276_c0_g1_i2.p1  ORF type:complete len:289 (-),score=70.01 TRINITY_DN276_c0_g1_i2:73-939(-)
MTPSSDIAIDEVNMTPTPDSIVSDNEDASNIYFVNYNLDTVYKNDNDNVNMINEDIYTWDGEEEDSVVDEFDPYYFISTLPEYEPQNITMLPPQNDSGKITLVLDLDETLVHCDVESPEGADFSFDLTEDDGSYVVYCRKRPGVDAFLEKVAEIFELVVFTASTQEYADQILDVLDPKGLIKYRLYRESCTFVEGNYIKDLSLLGREISRVAIVDNSPHVFGYQLDNGIPILSWYFENDDCELHKLLPFLERLIQTDNKDLYFDVRTLIRSEYELYKKVDAWKSLEQA